MSQNKKEFNKKKQAILDVAHELFCVNGYEQTSVNAIIEKAGISKGTFYHYFSAKENLMEGITQRLCSYKQNEIEAIYADSNIDALTKLHKLFDAGRTWREQHNAFFKILLLVVGNDENLMFRYKMHCMMMETLHFPLVQIIEQGAREGIFNAPSADNTSTMIINLLFHMRINVSSLFSQADTNPEAKTLIIQEIKMAEHGIERLLGMQEKTLHMLDEKLLPQLFNKEITQS